MRPRVLLLAALAAAMAGLLVWTSRSSDADDPALPEPAGLPAARDGDGVAAGGGPGGERIAVSDPARPGVEESPEVDPSQARESARLVVVGVPRSRLPDASRFVGARVEVSSAAARRPRVGRLDGNLRARFERLDPLEVFEVLVLPADGLRTRLADVRLEPGEEREVQVDLAAGGTLFGRVVDPLGAPLPGATLLVSSESDSDEPVWRRSAILDEDAAFELRGIRPGVVHAELHAGAVTLVEELGPIEEAQSVGPVELRLPEGHVLEGVVVWPDGTPAARARVAASPAHEDASARPVYAQADEEGRYRLPALAPRTYELKALPGTAHPDLADADGYRAWGEAVPPGTVDLTLEPGLSIHGTVVDDLGAPVPAFRVFAEQLRDDQGPAWRVGSEAVLPEAGAFVLRGLRPGAWLVSASDRGGVSAVEEELQLGAADIADLRLVLPRPARLRGVVLDAAGVGRAGVAVYAVPAPVRDGRVNLRAPRRTLSQTGGAFAIDRVAPGRVLVGRSSDDPRAVALDLAPGELREGVTITLDD